MDEIFWIYSMLDSLLIFYIYRAPMILLLAKPHPYLCIFILLLCPSLCHCPS